MIADCSFKDLSEQEMFFRSIVLLGICCNIIYLKTESNTYSYLLHQQYRAIVIAYQSNNNTNMEAKRTNIKIVYKKT